MNIFINRYKKTIDCMNGIMFYLLELMQFIREEKNGKCVEFIMDQETLLMRNLFVDRYDTKIDFTIDDSIFLNDCNVFLTMNALFWIVKEKNDIYEKLLNNKNIKIFLLNAAGIFSFMVEYVYKDLRAFLNFYKLKNKIILLSEPGFENEFYEKVNMKKIYIIRGLYFKNFKPIDNKKDYDTRSFIYSAHHYGTCPHNDNDYKKMTEFIKNNNIVYTEDFHTNPASTYKNLIYFRSKDYMPRLPYEFWYYNKDVHIITMSDGLEKRIKKYGKSIFDWNIENLRGMI